MASGSRKERRVLRTQMRKATTYAEWRAAAEELDWLEGNADWRADDHSPYYDAALLRRHISELETLPVTAIFSGGEKVKTFAGSGIERMVNRLRRVVG